MKWFGCELGAKSDFTDKEGEGQRALVTGSHQTGTLQELLDKFLGVYVLCPTCGLPELDLKTHKKSDDINGTCKACGFNGLLGEATVHKMAAYVLKNPMDGSGEDGKGAKKLTKEERRAKKKAQATGDDDDGGKKKKKKNKAAESDEDEDDEDSDDKKKKKKKDKKEKKDKKAKKSGSKDADSDGGEGGDQEAADSTEDTANAHKDEHIVDIITSLAALKDGKPEEFVEEARLKQISAGVDKKMLVYMCVEAIFGVAGSDPATESITSGSGTGTLTTKNAEKYSEPLVKLIKGENISVRDFMWGFELYVFEHQEKCLKGFPMVCKALYDMDLLDDKNFVEYYNDSKANKENPGHKMVHKAVAPFVKWLAESSSESESD